ncbi:glycosyltransferase [Catellatospora sichuanensis]|uniref:glycosyltransferase n=1 Tax=Catellatospora sichuanensis TaxID=1969805 RepID=UPI0011841FEC|nr:glycosyltransferase [Catellatospora sichuanensis]
MPSLLFYEAGEAPTTRSVRELKTLREHGWDITVAHMPDATERVEALGFRSCLLPGPARNAMYVHLRDEAIELRKQLEEIKNEIAQHVESVRSREAGPRARLVELRDEVEAHVARIAELRAAGDKTAEAAVRERLAAAKDERTAVAAHINAMTAASGPVLTVLKERRTELAVRSRAVKATRGLPTPITAGVTFGDLARFEPRWHAHAPVLATVTADVYWAADLDGLPPVIWAAEAAENNPPVVYDSHELFCELEYMPELYRAAWRQLADVFIPRATAVITVCRPIADVLDKEYGANGTHVIANYAAIGRPGVPAGLRSTVGVGADVPLAVHIGNVSRGRNPDLSVDLLAEFPELHVAFVGAASAEITDDLRQRASARGVASRLHFVPPVPLDEVSAFISDADLSLIMLDGSRSRDTLFTMPNKLFDSLSAGVPVIATEGSAAGDFLLAEELGCVFALNTTGALSSAVRRLLADTATRDRARSRVGQFTWAEAEVTLLSVLDGLLDRARADIADNAA